MKRSKKIIIIAICLFAIDLALTAYFIRNYYNYVSEGNPLIGIAKGYLIFVPNLLYFVCIIALVKYLDKYQTIIIEACGTIDYIKKLYKSDNSRFIFVSIASSFVYATLVSRVVVIIDWLLFGIYTTRFFQTKYAIIRNLMPFDKYDFIIGLIAFIIFIILWYKVEYKKSKKLINDDKISI